MKRNKGYIDFFNQSQIIVLMVYLHMLNGLVYNIYLLSFKFPTYTNYYMAYPLGNPVANDKFN